MCSRITKLARSFCTIFEFTRPVVGAFVGLARFVLGIINFIEAASNGSFVFTCALLLGFGFIFIAACYQCMFFRNGAMTIERNNDRRRRDVASFEGQKK